MNIKLVYYFLISLTLTEIAFARHGSHNPRWKEIIPGIAKEILPEESRDTLDKIFPLQEKSSQKKHKKKGGVDEYYEYTKLSGKMSNPIHIFGEGNLKNVYSNKKIEIDESAIVEKSQIDYLISHGSLKTKDSTFKNLKIGDSASFKNSKVLEKTQINGRLKAENTTFQSALLIGGQAATLKSCACQRGLRFLPFSSRQTLVLEKTKVKGNIVFEGEPGIVILKKNSQIEGKIKNGVIKTDNDTSED